MARVLFTYSYNQLPAGFWESMCVNYVYPWRIFLERPSRWWVFQFPNPPFLEGGRVVEEINRNYSFVCVFGTHNQHQRALFVVERYLSHGPDISLSQNIFLSYNSSSISLKNFQRGFEVGLEKLPSQKFPLVKALLFGCSNGALYSRFPRRLPPLPSLHHHCLC